jgi:hypothetical protein
MTQSNDAADAARKVQAVEDEIIREADRTMPGERAALPPGSLQRRPVDNQSDEHRDQPRSPDGALRKPDTPPGVA